MRSFNLFFLLTLVFSFVLLGSATPVETNVGKRDNAEIKSVLITLKSKTDVILPKITALSSSKSVTEASITPLLTELTTALSESSVSLVALHFSSHKRQSDDELAALIAGIINDIVAALETLMGDLSTIPLLAGLLADVDGALNEVLVGLGILLQGVLNLVPQLLVNVADLLRDIGLDLTFGTLGM